MEFTFCIQISNIIIRVDWKRQTIKGLIKAVAAQIQAEEIMIRLALCQRSNEVELAEHVRHYRIEFGEWDRWSNDIQNQSFNDFISGRAPFHLTHEVSSDGRTASPRSLAPRGNKPGTFTRTRKSIVAPRDRSLTEPISDEYNLYLYSKI